MFEHCLYFNTTSLARQLERQWVKAFKKFGLTPSQAFMLRIILQKGSISYTELAVELNITKATCSRSVDGLLKLDYIERVQTDTDARSYALVPLPAASLIHDELNRASAGVTAKIKGIIGDAQFKETVKNMREINNAVR